MYFLALRVFRQFIVENSYVMIDLLLKLDVYLNVSEIRSSRTNHKIFCEIRRLRVGFHFPIKFFKK